MATVKNKNERIFSRIQLVVEQNKKDEGKKKEKKKKMNWKHESKLQRV